MQTYDYIIIGQGIAGTMLALRLQKAGQRVLIYDDARPNSASRVASGIINPVSGRRFELAWLYETIFPFAETVYREIEQELNIQCFYPRQIYNIWPSPQMRHAFETTASPYMTAAADAPQWDTFFHQPYGAGYVQGANVQLHTLLPACRKALTVREERFAATALELKEDGVQYGDVRAKGVIFCEGVESPANPYFTKLKFLPNKGEALTIRCPQLQTSMIVKKGITLVPLGTDTYWAGATFSWDYTDALPTAAARASLEENLRQLLKCPFDVTDHLAAVRPSGPDRRPLAGLHPKYPQVGIFNGMGSKGCSIAPWAAEQFTRHLLEAAPLPPEIDIRRFFNALR